MQEQNHSQGRQKGREKTSAAHGLLSYGRDLVVRICRSRIGENRAESSILADTYQKQLAGRGACRDKQFRVQRDRICHVARSYQRSGKKYISLTLSSISCVTFTYITHDQNPYPSDRTDARMILPLSSRRNACRGCCRSDTAVADHAVAA